MDLYEILQNSGRVGEGMTHFERLFAQKVGGGKISEIFGVPPLWYIGDGRPLTDYRIYGDTVQDGTPSPDAPVDATGSGVRTGNLAPPISEFIGGYVDVNGNIHNPSGIVQEKSSEYIQIAPNTDYAFAFQNVDFPTGESGAWRAVGIYDENRTFIKRVSGNTLEPLVFNSGANAKFVRLSYRSYGSELNTMLNLGSTPLPYEPYGYKLPVTVNGVEYPIYLGTVPTTRRVKKQNVTISYMVQLANGNAGAVTEGFHSIAAASSLAKCNIASYGTSTIGSFYVNPRNAVFVCAPGTTLGEARTLLSGAVIWYILAEPETAVVNEPLMKIGDYADTISAAQSQVTIPTVSGENILDVPTTVPPSEVLIRGRIKEV